MDSKESHKIIGFIDPLDSTQSKDSNEVSFAKFGQAIRFLSILQDLQLNRDLNSKFEIRLTGLTRG
jgi:hypothetical protein